MVLWFGVGGEAGGLLSVLVDGLFIDIWRISSNKSSVMTSIDAQTSPICDLDHVNAFFSPMLILLVRWYESSGGRCQKG